MGLEIKKAKTCVIAYKSCRGMHLSKDLAIYRVNENGDDMNVRRCHTPRGGTESLRSASL